MAAPLDANGPALVGRSSELAAIADFLADVGRGTAATLVLTGDAGVGKTRLVRRACERAESGVMVLEGTCLPLASMTVPFLAIRAAVNRATRRLDVAGAGPDFEGTGDSPSDVLGAVDGWLDELCRDHVVVLFVDDLHWADQSTLDVLMFLIAGPAERRLAIIGAIRDGEVGEVHPLTSWLADIRRLPRVHWLRLGPLDRPETAEQLAGILRTSPHESLVEDVFRRTRGNPYLNRLLVKSIDPTALHLPDHLPSDLSSAVLQSWRRLSPDAREVTRLIAVVGIPSHARDLDAIAGERVGIGGTTALLHESVDAGILDAADDGRYWFHHPLFAEVLERTLDADERIALHAAVADHLERSLDASELTVQTVVAIADHRHAAHDSAAAYRWALRAADAAGVSGGTSEELRLLNRAVELRAEVPGVVEDAESLLQRVRRAAADGGAVEEELTAVDALLSQLDRRTEPLLAAELLVRRTHLRYSTGAAFMPDDDIRSAVELSAASPASWQHAFALAELAHALVWQDDAGASDLAAHALDLARACGDARALSYAMTAVTMSACEGPVPLIPDRAFTAEAVDAALAGGDWWGVMHAAVWEGNARSTTWASRGYAEVMHRRREQFAAQGAPHSCLAKLAADEASSSQMIGSWRECVEALRIALGSNPGPFADAGARLTAARLATWQGRQAEAEAHLARADELFSGLSTFLNFPFDAVRAEVCLGAGDAPGAFASALHGATAPGVPPTMSEWLIPLAARASADLVQHARDKQSGVDDAMARMNDLLARFPTVLQEPGEPSGVWRSQVEALNLEYAAEVSRARRDDDSADRWERAADACVPAMLAWEEAYSLWRASEALLVRPAGKAPDRERAASVLRRGVALAGELRAEPILRQLVELAASARIPLDPVTSESRDLSPLPGLTAREAEILRHVVAGRSYGEIARALVISEKTVSSHISNLLRKTGAENRIDLARMARAMTET